MSVRDGQRELLCLQKSVYLGSCGAGQSEPPTSYTVNMSMDEGVSFRRRVADFLGLTDSPRRQAKILENSTSTELLIRAAVVSAGVAIFTVVIFVEQGRGFTWFLLADLCFAAGAAMAWVRWGRYRNRWTR